MGILSRQETEGQMDGLSHVPQAGSRGALGPQKFERPVKQEAPDLSTVPHPQAGLVCALHPGQPAGMVSGRWSAWRSVSGRRQWAPSGFLPGGQLGFKGFLGSRRASVGWDGRWRGGYTRLPGRGVVRRRQLGCLVEGQGDRPAPSQGYHSAVIQSSGPKEWGSSLWGGHWGDG